MTIRLRAHHLLCMLTYIGKGYSPAFTANYDVIAGRLGKGEEIEIVAGPDDICAPRLAGEDSHHCFNESVVVRDEQAARDVSALLGLAVEPGVRIVPDAAMLAGLRDNFARGRIRQACGGCEWSELCTGIAVGNYAGVKVAFGDGYLP